MKKYLLFAIFPCLLINFHALAQGAYVPFNRDYYHLIERYEIKNGGTSKIIHTGFKPYRRDHLGVYLDSLASNPTISSVDAFNYRYLENDNWEFVSGETDDSKKPLFRNLYKKPADFYHYRDSVVDLHINPVIYFYGGIEPGSDKLRGKNSRGIEIRGSIDRKVAFYTYLTSTQIIFPSWVKDYATQSGAVPGEGFWKRYDETGYGYFSARGHVSFNLTKHIETQIGHDRNFIGEGYRSMILSDFSNPYLFLKINTKIWKFQFTNLWSQQTADIIFERQGRPTDGRYPRKWYSVHRLGMNIGKNLNIGIYESIMKDHFDFNYLNPVIFYRWVEHQLGSPDKLMLGTDFKWNFTPGMQLYGQFALDEFVFNEFFEIEGKGSMRNKHGLQAGYKYIDAFKVRNLDLQLEYNHARPYTYQEKQDYESYSNYRTPLTHPLGANFREALAIIRYQPIPKLFVNATAMYQYFGADPDAETNFGKDVLKNRRVTNTGLGLYGHSIGQGVENRIAMGTLNISYMVKQNIFLDFSQTYRRRTAQDLSEPETTNYFQLALRINSIRQDFNF